MFNTFYSQKNIIVNNKSWPILLLATSKWSSQSSCQWLVVWYSSDGATREGFSWWLQDRWSNKVMNVFWYRPQFSFLTFFSCRKHTRLYVGMTLSPSHRNRLQENQKLMMFLMSHSLVTLHLSPLNMFWQDYIVGFVKGLEFVPYLIP